MIGIMASNNTANTSPNQETQSCERRKFEKEMDPFQEERLKEQKSEEKEAHENESDQRNENTTRVKKSFGELLRKQTKGSNRRQNIKKEQIIDNHPSMYSQDRTDREHSIPDHWTGDLESNLFSSCVDEAVFRQQQSIEDDYLQIVLSIARHNAESDTIRLQGKPLKREDIQREMPSRPAQLQVQQHDLQWSRDKPIRYGNNRVRNKSYYVKDDVRARPYSKQPCAFVLPNGQGEKYVKQNISQMAFRDNSVLQGGQVFGTQPLVKLRRRQERYEDTRADKSIFQTIDGLKKSVENIALDRRGMKKRYDKLMGANVVLTEQCQQLNAQNLQLKQKLKCQTDNVKLSQQQQIRALRDIVEEKQKRLEIYQDRMLLAPTEGRERSRDRNILTKQNGNLFENYKEYQSDTLKYSMNTDTFMYEKREKIKCREENSEKSQDNQFCELKVGLNNITDEIKDVKQRVDKLDLEFTRSKNFENNKSADESQAHSKTSQTKNISNVDGVQIVDSSKISVIEMMALMAGRPPTFGTQRSGVMIQEIFSSEEDKDGGRETAGKRSTDLVDDRSIDKGQQPEECSDPVREEVCDEIYFLPQVNHVRADTQADRENASFPILQVIDGLDSEDISDESVPVKDEQRDGPGVGRPGVETDSMASASVIEKQKIQDGVDNERQDEVGSNSQWEELQKDNDAQKDDESEQSEESNDISGELSSSLIRPTVRSVFSLEENASDEENKPAWEMEASMESHHRRQGYNDHIELLPQEDSLLAEQLNQQPDLPTITGNLFHRSNQCSHIISQRQTSAQPAYESFGEGSHVDEVVHEQHYRSSENKNKLKYKKNSINNEPETCKKSNTKYTGHEFQYEVPFEFAKDWKSVSQSSKSKSLLTKFKQNDQGWDDRLKQQMLQCLLQENANDEYISNPLAKKHGNQTLANEQQTTTSESQCREDKANEIVLEEPSSNTSTKGTSDEYHRKFGLEYRTHSTSNNFQGKMGFKKAVKASTNPIETTMMVVQQSSPTTNSPSNTQAKTSTFSDFVFSGSTITSSEHPAKPHSQDGRVMREGDLEQLTQLRPATEQCPAQKEEQCGQQQQYLVPAQQRQYQQEELQGEKTQERPNERERTQTEEQKQQSWQDYSPQQYIEKQAMYQQQEVQQQRMLELLQHLNQTQYETPRNRCSQSQFQTYHSNNLNPENIQGRTFQQPRGVIKQTAPFQQSVGPGPVRQGQLGHCSFPVSQVGQGSDSSLAAPLPDKPQAALLPDRKPKQASSLKLGKRSMMVRKAPRSTRKQ